MKKVVGMFAACLLICLMSFTAFASEGSVNNEKEDRVLVSTSRIDHEDGTYTIERVYKHNNMSSRSGDSGTDTYTREASTYSLGSHRGTLICTYEVTATFSWDVASKKVTVSDAYGNITYKNGESYGADYTNEKTTTSGNNTSKATAKFSFTRSPKENTTSYNHYVTVSCNYKGTESGTSR